MGNSSFFGKHFIFSVKSHTLSPEIKKLLREIKPAGILLDGSCFMQTENYPIWHQALSKLIKEAKELTGRKNLIVCIDHEGGRVHRTPKPLTKLPYAESYSSFSGLAGEIHATELKSIGVNLTLGPVCDINSNFENPVIGARAFGETADQVIAAVLPYINSLEKQGIRTCLKHFPGHGDTCEDTHTGFASVLHSKEKLFERELKPFLELSEQVSAIMTSHVLFNNIDDKCPATLSKNILTNILRGEIGFEGLVISDDMDMRAMSDNFSNDEIPVLALNAGCDMFLFNHNPERAFIFSEILEKANADRKLNKDNLKKSSKRIDNFLSKVEPSNPKILNLKVFTQNKLKLEKAMSANIKENDFFTKEGIKLRDPEPRKMIPPTSEPQLRVGIIIEDDNKKEVHFTCPSEALAMLGDSTELTLEPNKRYKIVANNGFLNLYLEGQILSEIKGFFKLKLKNEGELEPNSGIEVENIVAGRHFHWKKEVSQTLPGLLEFLPDEDRIILVNTIGFEFYVTCVVSSEMGKVCPKEFCKAQATSARSWARVFLESKYPGKAYTLCNDDISQRYQGTSFLSEEVIESVKECFGDYLISEDGNICASFYSKSTGGHGEDCKLGFGIDAPGLKAQFDCDVANAPKLDLRNEEDFKVWLNKEKIKKYNLYCSENYISEKDLPQYLGAVDEPNEYFRWKHQTSSETVISNLKEKFLVPDVSSLLDIIPGERGVSGRFLNFTVLYRSSKGEEKKLELKNEYNIRACFHKSFLFSSAFTYDLEKDDAGIIKNINFEGAGWGHGIGFCQIGALGMALKGKSYKEILGHYFPEAGVVKGY